MQSIVKSLRVVFSAKLGRCARCMRLSAKGMLLGWAGVAGVALFWPDAQVPLFVILPTVGFTVLWLVHVTIFAARGTRASRDAGSGQAEDYTERVPVPASGLGRRSMLGLFVKTALFALIATALPASVAAKCVQLPVCCSSNSDCTCSKCCGEWQSPPCPAGICQPSC